MCGEIDCSPETTLTDARALIDAEVELPAHAQAGGRKGDDAAVDTTHLYVFRSALGSLFPPKVEGFKMLLRHCVHKGEPLVTLFRPPQGHALALWELDYDRLTLGKVRTPLFCGAALECGVAADSSDPLVSAVRVDASALGKVRGAPCITARCDSRWAWALRRPTSPLRS